jgi:poly-gamma-glutamate capsule biosynthesis protein CapA/YwtB (metallophosphatase superfamily)
MVSKESNPNDLLIYAAGDVVLRNTADFKAQFDYILATLREADIRYCAFEQLLSDRGFPTRIIPPCWRLEPKFVEGLKYAGFDIVSLNGNHAWDFGTEAFVDTIDNLQKNGIETVGAGKDIHEARRPAIIERKGTKIAFLSYNSILPYGAGADMYVAKEEFPGVAPMRVYTFYEQAEIEQPGTPCRIHTFPYREDLKAMKQDIEKAKSSADIVVLALHFGVHNIRAEIAEYQPDVCYAAIDAGADVIIGTHTHLQKAIEVYKGKVIFYSLANFAFDGSLPPNPSPALVEKFKYKKAYWARYQDNKKKPTDELETSIAKIVVSDKKIKRVSFIPLLVNENDEPYRPEPGSPGFDQSVNYTIDVTKEAGIDTKFRVEGGEVVVVV